MIRREETDLDVEISNLGGQHVVARHRVQSGNRNIYTKFSDSVIGISFMNMFS